MLTASDISAEATTREQSAITMENISILYRVAHEQYDTLKEFAIRRLQGKVVYKQFWALNGVNLTVKKGDVFGVIGRNGAGKTTLLKVIARILRPTKGRVCVNGLVAPLFGTNAGLHSELTGRENIFLNGTILGFSTKQIQEKFDRIVDFAELWEFIDAPLRTYSSGMIVRLGFSIATDARPDILIIDESLSVGDQAFQQKSSARIKKFSEEGSTIVVVTHSMGLVQSMCTQAAWIEKGEVKASGSPANVVEAYLAEVDAT